MITLFLPDTIAIRLLRGGFEAGLVGGIADWFAVTALFRHPLGLPIPHTSLLLKNRDKIVQSLISAMENELLNKESIRSKLAKLNFVAMGGGMLTRFIGRRKARQEILAQLAGFVSRVPLEPAVPRLQSALGEYVRRADLGGAADKIVTRLMNDRKDEAALDYVLDQAAEWSGRPETKAMLGGLAAAKLAEVKLGGLKGMAFQAFVGFVDEAMLGDLLQNMLMSGIRDFREGDSEYRQGLLREMRVALFGLIQEEERIESVRSWAVGSLEGEEARDFLLARLEEVRERVLLMIEQDRLSGGKKLFALYAMLARRISREQEWIQGWEERIRGSLIRFVQDNHYRIGSLVKENLDQMDDASLVGMLEEKIGQDLQWIRVNGALCGFIIGLGLTVIHLLV